MTRSSRTLFGSRARPWRLLGVGVVAGALVLGGLAGVSAKDQSETVALGGATSARVEVTMGFGRLRLAGAGGTAGTPMPAEELLRGEFRFDADELGPELAYAVAGGVGTLTVEQKGGDDFSWPWEGEDRESDWDLVLNPAVPTDLTITLGAGEGALAFGGLSLTGLRVTLGAGETTLDFAGAWPQGLAAAVEHGVGELTLRLPRAVGVRVAVEHGLGDVTAEGFAREGDAYVHEAAGAAVALDLAVEQGVGNLTLELVD